MSRNSSRGAVGALHPILFFAFVYGISLCLAFFICHAVYNSLHISAAAVANELPVHQAKTTPVQTMSSATAMR